MKASDVYVFYKSRSLCCHEELLHVYWFVPTATRIKESVLCAHLASFQTFSIRLIQEFVVHINSLRMSADDARLVNDVVDLFQVDLKTGLAIEEACYAQVCLHNQHFHES